MQHRTETYAAEEPIDQGSHTEQSSPMCRKSSNAITKPDSFREECTVTPCRARSRTSPSQQLPTSICSQVQVFPVPGVPVIKIFGPFGPPISLPQLIASFAARTRSPTSTNELLRGGGSPWGNLIKEDKKRVGAIKYCITQEIIIYNRYTALSCLHRNRYHSQFSYTAQCTVDTVAW